MSRAATRPTTLKPEFLAAVAAMRETMERAGILKPLGRELARPAGAAHGAVLALLAAAVTLAATEASDVR